MTTGGWITFLVSLLSVLSLFCWCLYKVFISPNTEESESIDEAFEIFDKESDKVIK